MMSFKSTSSLSSFIFKRLFSSSSLSAVRVVSSACLRLLIFLPAFLIPAGIKSARRNINNLRYADDTTLVAQSQEELKSLLMKVKQESEKAGLKLNIQEKIMASSPITSWQIGGETMEMVKNFIFLGSKITADGDCSHETKRCLLLGRKAMTNITY